jgi:hypothetical protein
MDTKTRVLKMFSRKPQPSLRAIADAVGVSRERVRQILDEHGLKSELGPTGRPRAETTPIRAPVMLSSDQIRDAAKCAREAAARARRDAAAQKNPTVSDTFKEEADRYERLARVFDATRRG